ncbi:MAG: hypothetical protein HC918_00920 [Oscillatoriales cyanobacterium SM2_1_8]|nr:hypothetical protein [Oscillatoriales cyanobacterium SM2_1_8]
MAPTSEYALALPGAHQFGNAAIAVALVRSLQARGWAIPETAIEQGLRETKWPGRLQTVAVAGRAVLVDGAHNLDGIHRLRNYVDSLSPTLATGLSAFCAPKTGRPWCRPCSGQAIGYGQSLCPATRVLRSPS